MIIRFLFLILMLCFSMNAYALDMTHFKTIPVLHEARVKPLDSFARAQLKKFLGKDHTKDQPAIDWLAETIFAPDASIENPVFQIDNVNLRHSLGLQDRKLPVYSFAELVPGLKRTSPAVTALLKKETAQLTRSEKDLLQVHDNAFAYTSLLRSLSLLLPLDVSLPKKYKNGTAALSYLDLKKLEQDLVQDVKNIVAVKGENLGRYTEEEKRTALLAYQLQLLSAAAAMNDTLKIIPPQWESDQGDWHAPWELLQKGEGSPKTAELLDTWRAMGEAFRKNDSLQWSVKSSLAQSLSTPPALQMRLTIEEFQNVVPPFKVSLIFYIFALALTFVFLIFNNKNLYRIAVCTLSLGALVQCAGLCIRIFLLMRPPVGTLYESLLFVSLITVLISLAVEKFTRNGTGLLLGSLSGTALGLLSLSFAGDGDTMEMLTAVLNTNFWLATHVLCITMGYGWCILTAVFAHLYLAAKPLKLEKFKTQNSHFIIYMLTILSLLFTSIGTILGGIWADQSWGRFWGWDPKENGALLIVLWIIWLLHGKLGKQLNENQFLAGLAFLNVVVGLSWIGVNLLGVGMHSYGFADGLFYGLGIFILVEMVLICILMQLNRVKKT